MNFKEELELLLHGAINEGKVSFNFVRTLSERLEKNEINFTGDFQRLTPLPDDVFVISCEMHLREEQVENIHKMFKHVFPNHKLMVLGSGLKMDCINQGAKP